MEILKAMSIKASEFSKGLILRGVCRHTAAPYVFEVIRKNDKYYLRVRDSNIVLLNFIKDKVNQYIKDKVDQYGDVGVVSELSDICDYEEITDTTIRGVFNQIIRIINYHNKEDGLDKQLPYI